MHTDFANMSEASSLPLPGVDSTGEELCRIGLL